MLGSIDIAALRQRFPAGTDFAGPIPTASAQTGNGRPFFAPHAFTFKVVVTPTTGTPRSGEDRRTAWLHRDRDLLGGFPRSIREGGALGGPEATPTADGASSPAFADLDGDNRNELIFADSDGFVHAIEADGSELPGWPVRGEVPGFVGSHGASPAYAGGEVGTDLGGAFLGAVAVGDADRDGIPEVYAADVEGRVYGWSPDGSRVFEEESNPDFSGRPLTPFVNVRNGKTNRTQHGFFGAPVLADLDGDGHDEVIAASMDRHVYAWSADDSDPSAPGGADAAPGFPVLVVDPAKVASVDPDTHAVTFTRRRRLVHAGGDHRHAGRRRHHRRRHPRGDRRDQRGVRRAAQPRQPRRPCAAHSAPPTPATRASTRSARAAAATPIRCPPMRCFPAGPSTSACS